MFRVPDNESQTIHPIQQLIGSALRYTRRPRAGLGLRTGIGGFGNGAARGRASKKARGGGYLRIKRMLWHGGEAKRLPDARLCARMRGAEVQPQAGTEARTVRRASTPGTLRRRNAGASGMIAPAVEAFRAPLCGIGRISSEGNSVDKPLPGWKPQSRRTSRVWALSIARQVTVLT